MIILTVKEVSALINVKPVTVYAWAQQGKIPGFKLNGSLRFDKTEIQGWVKSCKESSISYNVAMQVEGP